MLIVADVLQQRLKPMTTTNRNHLELKSSTRRAATFPAVTHVDYSARIQTVRGEPIVGTPEEALRCFMGTNMEVLAIVNCFLAKKTRIQALRKTTNPVSSSIETLCCSV